MTTPIQVTEVDDVPGESRIHHYDELAPPAKEHFPRIVEGERVGKRVADSLEGCEVVKYTSYYEVSVTGGRSSD